MVVQHNMQAQNANRMLNITTGQQSKSTEKLTSGFKINRAADDAAGLSISEKMRKQVRGLNRASTNAEDGVSAVQTAEGALTEVHSMLQRMNELAVQAANGTNSTTDREAIQNEISQLTTEIDRVAETTKFNETYLLRGAAGTKTVFLKGHDAGLKGTFVDGATKASIKVSLTIGSSVSIGGRDYNIVRAENKHKEADDLQKIQKDISGMQSTAEIGKTISVNGTVYTFNKDGLFETGSGTQYEAGEISAMIKDGDRVSYSLNGNKAKLTIARDKNLTTNISQLKAARLMTIALKQANDIGTGNKNLTTKDEKRHLVGYGSASSVDYKGTYASFKTKATDNQASTITFTITKGHITVEQDLGFALHVGADADLTNKIGVNVEVMSSKNLGISGLNVLDDSGIAATYAIDAIQDAIVKVSSQRSALGAVQNRLEHTIANLDNVAENTDAAESRIRDTDMASEMVTFSKNNILAQAGQSMLAQANQSNQGVLSLLG